MQHGSDVSVPETPILLGRYRLQRVLGRGAMGEVWAATTPLIPREVAIKVALEHDPSDPWAGRALDNEVATAAHLDHPGIVAVLDHGRVDLLAHTASNGRLPVGAAFIVMELLHGRSLHEFIGRLSWVEVQEVLRQLLDALGHCHARGVIHRDLKPGNVVVDAGEEAGPSRLHVSLMDFGLARYFEQFVAAEENVAGTPAYMAPEQLQGVWRAQGPPTDLYSVGCLGWTLITGAPPFGRRRSYQEFLEDHLHLRPPPLDPMIGVPVAAEDWLRRLLAKSPMDRFPSAADARASLDLLPSGHELDAPTIEPVAPPVRMGESSDEGFDEISLGGLLSTANLAGADRMDALFEDDTRDDVVPGTPPVPGGWKPSPAPTTFHRASLPPGWRRPRLASTHPLEGEGLGVFGHRGPRLIGRLAERDRLWATLCETQAHCEARVVVVRGEPGVGKSRLAAWLCETAHELAGVESIRATFAATEEADAGLLAMFRRRLRLEGLAPSDWKRRVQQALLGSGLDDIELEALVAALVPVEESVEAPVRFAAPQERRALFARLAARLTVRPSTNPDETGRSGIVWLDEAHLSTEALDFALHVDRTRGLGPVLVILTISDLSPADGGTERLATLLARERVVQVPVEPLPATDHRALVDSLLRLEPTVAAALTARTAGNPRLAVNVVADWVARGVLEPGPQGFSVPDPVITEVPADALALWKRSLDGVLAELSTDQLVVMELAATLGMRVDTEEWRAACARSRVRPSPATLDLWGRSHLVERLQSGFAFAHASVREALEQAASRAGRSRRHHRVCATVVELQGTPGPDTSGRVARHLLAAGDDRDALAYLLQAARGHAKVGEAERVLRWLDLWDDTAERSALSRDAPERRVVWTLRLDALWLVGSPEHGPATVRLYNEAGTRHDLRGLAAVHRALHAYQRGEFLAARTELARAAAYASEDVHLSIRIGLEQVRLALESGNLDGARDLLRTVRASAVHAHDPQAIATVSWLLGRIEKQSGNLSAAHTAFTHAVNGYEQVRDRNGLARCTNELGEIARLEGDLDTAQLHYRHALRMMVQLNSDNTDIVRVNLGLVLLSQKDWDRARSVLETALGAFQETGRLALNATTQVALLSCAAVVSGWAEWDTRLLSARRDLTKSRFVDVDLAWLLENAADLAQQAGQDARADAALAIAEAQWKALDRPVDLARVRDRRLPR